jgi:hypothetical protein
LPVVVDQADQGDRHVEEALGEPGDAIEPELGARVEEPEAEQGRDPCAFRGHRHRRCSLVEGIRVHRRLG